MDPMLKERLLRMTADMGFEPYKYTPFKDPALNLDDDSDSSAGSPDSPDGSGDEGAQW